MRTSVTRTLTYLGLHKERKRVKQSNSLAKNSAKQAEQDRLPGSLVSIRWPRRPCWCCNAYMTSHKYLSQLSSTCEQRPIGKKQHICKSKNGRLQDLRCSANSYSSSPVNDVTSALFTVKSRRKNPARIRYIEWFTIRASHTKTGWCRWHESYLSDIKVPVKCSQLQHVNN